MNEIRLQLALAKAGLASRRHAEELIVAGRVAVNGKVVTQLGSRVDPVSDHVTVDGKPVLREAPAYYLMNKPKGYVTTADDPEGRPTVFSLLKGPTVRLFSVGRLDYNTEGALLLTNDGELAHALMHPSRGVAKVYHAKFRGVVSRDQLAMLRRGVELPPARPLDQQGRPLPTAPGSGRAERSAPAEVTTISSTGRHTWLQFILHEGKNRQIHRMAEAVGSSLLKLLRVEYAGLSLFDLPVGEYRPLQSREVLELRQSLGLSAFVAQQGPVKPRARPEPGPAPAARERSAARGHDASPEPARPGRPLRGAWAPEPGRRPPAPRTRSEGESARRSPPGRRAWEPESGRRPSAPRAYAEAAPRRSPPGRAAWEPESERRPPAPRVHSEAESARRPPAPRVHSEAESARRPPAPRVHSEAESARRPPAPRVHSEAESARRPPAPRVHSEAESARRPPAPRVRSQGESARRSPPRAAWEPESERRPPSRRADLALADSGWSPPRRAAGGGEETPRRGGRGSASTGSATDAPGRGAPPQRPKRREPPREPPRELPPDWPPR